MLWQDDSGLSWLCNPGVQLGVYHVNLEFQVCANPSRGIVNLTYSYYRVLENYMAVLLVPADHGVTLLTGPCLNDFHVMVFTS